MIHSVFDLHRVTVQEIMVPRPKITCLPPIKDLGVLLAQMVENQHSRVPIYDGSPDHIIGILNSRDLLGVALERQRRGVPLATPFDVRAILHTPMIVPESMSLNQMLKEARRRHSQMALVVDEFGTFVGLVTIEDVLEEIVGEIQDEYDTEVKVIRKVGENVFELEASISVRALAEDYQLQLPRDAGYSTLAGFVLTRLGAIPKGGETFTFEERRYTVTEMEGRRVARVKVEKLPGQAEPASGKTAAPGASLPSSVKPV
jgi:putative hemolysin